MRKVYKLPFLILFFILLVSPVFGESGYEDWSEIKTGVSPDKIWTITFNEELEEASVNAQNIFVKDDNGTLVSLSLYLDQEKTKVQVLPPSGGYSFGETYFLYIKDTVESAKGKALSKGLRMQFTIREEIEPQLGNVWVHEDSFSAIQGNTVYVPVGIKLPEGVDSVTCSISPYGNGEGTFSEDKLYGDGGTLLSIDTTYLPYGAKTYQVSAYDGATLVGTDSFVINILEVNEIRVVAYDDNWNEIEVTSSLTYHKQQEIPLYYHLYQGSTELEGVVTLSSSNQNAVEVLETAVWGANAKLYAVAEGSSQITVRAPNGYERTFVVTVDFNNDNIKILALQADRTSVSNSGAEKVLVTGTLSKPMDEASSYGCGTTGALMYEDGYSISQDGYQYTRSFYGTTSFVPGKCVAELSVGESGENATRAVAVEVVNDSTKGMIKGGVYFLREYFKEQNEYNNMIHVQGVMEFYDATTLELKQSIEFFESHGEAQTFVIGWITPGNYKIRFVPDSYMAEMTNLDMSPRWFVKDGQSAAEIVNISAGTTVEEIHFFFGGEE